MCGTNYQTGKFTIHRKTIGKRMAAKLKDIRVQLRKRMHARVPGTVKWLQQVVRGYFQYHAIPGNWARLRAFRREMARSWLQVLRCRSQRHRMSWERFNARLDPLLPPVQVLHPYPDARFAAKYPHILGKNRVRLQRQHGSVRGAASNRCPYRDSANELLMTHRNPSDDIETGERSCSGIEHGRYLLTGHAVSGIEAA